jgi:hypothetical protein
MVIIWLWLLYDYLKSPTKQPSTVSSFVHRKKSHEKLTNLPLARCQKVSRKGLPDSQTASILSLQIPPTVWEVPSSRRNLSSAPAAMGIKNLHPLHTHLVIHYHFKSSKTSKEQTITSCVPHSYATWLHFYTIQSKCAPKQRPHVC